MKTFLLYSSVFSVDVHNMETFNKKVHKLFIDDSLSSLILLLLIYTTKIKTKFVLNELKDEYKTRHRVTFNKFVFVFLNKDYFVCKIKAIHDT